MAKKKILVLTDSLPWGHRSIALAIFRYLKEATRETEYDVEFAQVKAELGIANDVYTFLCRYMPSTHRIAYRIASVIGSQEELLRDISSRSLPELKKLITRVKPDLVISSYFIHTHCLAKWREDEKKQFKLWTLVTDPRSIGPMAYDKGADLHIVYDEVAEKYGIKLMGIPPQKFMKTGWWVRPEMYDPKLRTTEAREKIKRKLGFNDDRPVVFVGGGSLGTSSLATLLPVLMAVKKKVGLILNTGTDKMSFNLVDQYMRLYRRVRKDDTVIIKNMGWIENMAEILSAADIVFGKAGPNFLFDTIASGKPFVAITHVGGQEDGNLSLIRQKKLGWIKEKSNEAADFFLKYLENPKLYEEKYAASIKTEAERNKLALPMIWERIKREI